MSEDENAAALCSKAFLEKLAELNKTEYQNEKLIVLGPGPAKICRYRLSIKCKNSKSVRKLLNEILKTLSKIKEYKDVAVTIDLNPYELN